MKLEWGILSAWNDMVVQPMPDEETADRLCGEADCVVFRYVGEWFKADA